MAGEIKGWDPSRWAENIARIEATGLAEAEKRPEGRRLSQLVKQFLDSEALPSQDPLRKGLEYFLRRRLLDPMLARSDGGLIEHVKVASGRRQGMQTFDYRKDTSPNHAETLVLGMEALVHLEQHPTAGSGQRELASLLNPKQSGFRAGKSDAELVQQIASQAITALEITETRARFGY